MNASTYILIGITCLLTALLFLARWLYVRSMRIRNRMQLNVLYTNIAHELLTPLSILSASIEQLRQNEPKGKQQYDLMDLNIQRTVRLLQNMLEASKSQSGELKLLVSNGDVIQYVIETARCIEPLMARRGLDFTISCHPESMMGWIDTDKVDKIIFNLLTNAAKYSKEKGKVALSVTTNRKYDHIIIKVSDNGNGIPKDRMRHLFTRFQDGEYRSHHTFGTGLGLSLTHDLVYLHRGNIHCESVENEGTTFYVELPISKEAFSSSQIDEKNSTMNLNHSAIADLKATSALSVYPRFEAQPPTDEEASHILIVEDNEELLMLMTQLMQSKYHIHTATNGHEALLILRSSPIDRVVSDVMMPVMDGYELTTTIKHDESFSHLPVILLTAKTQDSDKEEALTIGADDCIAKPFKLGDLLLRIDNLIANRQRILHDKRSVEQDEETIVKKPITAEQEFQQRATRCVLDHLDDADYSREAFAADMGLSTSTLYNKVREATGTNIVGFIRDIRIKEACRMARENPELRVSDIAYRVGFKDPKYFATSFKKVMGVQPKEYFDKLKGQ